MSELKLQQAVLERENIELRATHFNNNTIPADRRLPPVPNVRIRTNSSSGSMVIFIVPFLPSSFHFKSYTQFVSCTNCRRHRRHSDVRLISIITVFRALLRQPHQRQSIREAVRQTIHRSIQMQTQNEMWSHSVNNLQINTSRIQRQNLPRIYVSNKRFCVINPNRPICVTVFKNKKESQFQT